MSYLIAALMVALVAVLAAGIFLMGKGGEANKKYGNQLMFWRVALQGGILMLLALMFAFGGK